MTIILKEMHYADIIQSRVEKNLIITSIGMYRLIGPPKPINKRNERFYNFWMISGGGFPKNFIELYYTRGLIYKDSTFIPDNGISS